MTAQSTKMKKGAAVIKKVVPLAKKKDAPFRAMRNMLEIEAYFNECILDQHTSIRTLSTSLSKLIYHTLHNDKGKQDIYMFALAGPSSTGKSKTMKRMRHLLGMAEGYEFEGLFLEYYINMMDEDDASMGESELATKHGADIILRITAAIKSMKTPPPYVMLFVHNFGHATSKFKTVINNIVCGNTSLLLPAGTKLLIACTCHYGGEKIIDMQSPYDDDMAEQFIRIDMRRSIVDSTTDRIDLFLPYYPLSQATVKQLLHNKLNKIIDRSDIVEQFGAQTLKATPAMKDMLINHVISKCDKSGGLHSTERVLTNKVNQIFQAAIAIINGLQKKPISDTIYLEHASWQTRVFSEILERALDPETTRFIQSLKDDPRNRQMLAKCDPNREGTVDTVSMRYGELPLCGMVMNVNYVVINNYYDTVETTKITEELKAKNKELKGCLIAVNKAVKKVPHDAIGGIIKNHKKLFNDSSDDSNEDSDTTLRLHNKRKADNTDERAMTSKKARIEDDPLPSDVGNIEEDLFMLEELTFSEEDKFDLNGLDLEEILKSDEEWEYIPPVPKKKGRPYKEIAGFIRIETGKRPKWACQACNECLSKIAYTKNHKCL